MGILDFLELEVKMCGHHKAHKMVEYERLKKLGAAFTMEPTSMGPATVAVFDDTCGNLIQLAQV